MMNKTVVIVGASRGIGKELVLLFAQNPTNKILALGRNLEAMKIFATFPNVEIHSFDLEHDDVLNCAKEIFAPLDKIDILINNAGKLINRPFVKLTASDIYSSYKVNVIGVMQTVQAALNKMISTESHIVNISSIGGFQGTVKFPGLSAYSTSKAALVSFTELFAEEYKDSKIKMNCLCLGAVQTEMLEEAFPAYKAPITAAQMAEFIHDFALKANQFMNGKIIPVSLSTP